MCRHKKVLRLHNSTANKKISSHLQRLENQLLLKKYELKMLVNEINKLRRYVICDHVFEARDSVGENENDISRILVCEKCGYALFL